MSFLQLVLSLDKTKDGFNSIQQRAVMRIATMEAMNEDTLTMTLFFTLLNEVL